MAQTLLILARSRMKFSQLKASGHWPTLLTSFLYFDVSFMVWTILGALGALIASTLDAARAHRRERDEPRRYVDAW